MANGCAECGVSFEGSTLPREPTDTGGHICTACVRWRKRLSENDRKFLRSLRILPMGRLMKASTHE